ncbi:MAG: glycerol-3-phosphate 1-O-acyltransferase PlsY [Acidobacteria bacterium]|nr:glycerol-3-phosphate 1-O-acyltransferase PlsY [Acidobacteriota bacterium]
MSPLFLGYFVGSLPLGFLIARVRGGVDLRLVGSGNVGAANVYRSVGRTLGASVLVLDMAKGAAGVLLARWLWPEVTEHGLALAGFGAIVGHVYPMWLRFSGGKGVAVACGVFAMLAPWATLAGITMFAGATWWTRYVSLGSVIATMTLPVVEWTLEGGGPIALAATATALLIVFRHRGNIARMASGTERRLGQQATEA